MGGDKCDVIKGNTFKKNLCVGNKYRIRGMLLESLWGRGEIPTNEDKLPSNIREASSSRRRFFEERVCFYFIYKCS